MKQALDLASRAMGQTSPNPMVGAVIVKDGRVIGRGYHRCAGAPHAEIEALKDCSDSPEGATVYVNLEPCCHVGRTPPCTRALIEACVARVVFAVQDPNPLMSGKSVGILRNAGIQVTVGVEESRARFLNRAFFHTIQNHRPYVTAKIAMSLDGKIATQTGESQWITSPAAREHGHHLRKLSDAIMVGARTVQADDPRLTVRLPDACDRHPLRVILDSSGTLPLDRKVFSSDLPGRTLVATTPAMRPARREELMRLGVDVMITPEVNGKVDLSDLMVELHAMGIMNLMVEGGATLLGQLLHRGMIQEVWVLIAPRILGGHRAPSPFGDPGVLSLDDAAQLQIYDTIRLDRDVCIKALVTRGQQESALSSPST